MPRQMGELRRLLAEWNSLVPLARDRGVRRLAGVGRINLRQHFHMDRVVARQRVALLRASVAPFFQPSTVADLGADTFGVEIELIMPQGVTRGHIASEIRAAGVNCMEEQYNHITRTHWKVTTDASLGYGSGAEIVSPPLSGEAGFESLRRVCGVITRLGCKVNRDCGLHVHVGVGNRGAQFLKNLARIYKRYEPTIDAFLAPSRRVGGYSHQWCEPIHLNEASMSLAATVNDVMMAVNQPPGSGTRSFYRYRRVNFLPFSQPGTVEFRQHQGTVEAQKTEMWVRLCLRIVAKATSAADADYLVPSADFDGLMDFVGCDAAERTYFSERREYFVNHERDRRAA